MSFLLDTNVLSEVRRPKPHLGVMQWLNQLDEDHAFISVITLAEIQRGIALMDRGRKRDALAQWATDDLQERFADRILLVNQQTAIIWGDLMAASQRRGFALASLDGFLAATAIYYELTLVTRNTKDFSSLGVDLLDPWTDATL